MTVESTNEPHAIVVLGGIRYEGNNDFEVALQKYGKTVRYFIVLDWFSLERECNDTVHLILTITSKKQGQTYQ